MFYNRLNREYPVQVQRQLSRPFFSHTLNNLSQYTTTELPFNSRNWGWGTQLHTAAPATDILELDDQYILEIALPGVVLDDVELKVEENYITVIAKRTPNMFEERAQLLRKEMPCGYFVRTFEFDTLIIHEHIEARMDRGILFVSVPKVEAALRIPVSAGSIEQHLPMNVKTRIGSKSEQMIRGEKVTVK
jgi:HSP20 family molecular chaperone IbpA